MGEVPTQIGPRLRKLRVATGRSLSSVAHELGISSSALSQIETGVMQPSVNRLIELVGVLGVPVSAIFDDRRTVRPATARRSRRRDGAAARSARRARRRDLAGGAGPGGHLSPALAGVAAWGRLVRVDVSTRFVVEHRRHDARARRVRERMGRPGRTDLRVRRRERAAGPRRVALLPGIPPAPRGQRHGRPRRRRSGSPSPAPAAGPSLTEPTPRYGRRCVVTRALHGRNPRGDR